MRSCFLSLLVIILITANGYCIWQIHELRARVDELHADVASARDDDVSQMLDHARDAVEALGHGEIERAQEELERLGELVEDTRVLARQKRDRLRRHLEEASEAIDRGSARASELVQAIVRELSPQETRDEPEGPEDDSQEP